MRILLETDVILDVLLGNHPFAADAIAILRWAEDNPGQALVVWQSLTNVTHIVREDPKEFLNGLLEFVEVAPVSTNVARQALAFPIKDIEDAVQAAAAVNSNARYIVTRNWRRFRHSPVPAISPAMFLKQVAGKI